MKQLQKWFELVAGVSREEMARKIFGATTPDLQLLQKPACWRRQRRIGVAQA